MVIPTVAEDGSVSVVRATIGPASQIVAVPLDRGENDPDVREFVEEISDRAKRYMRGRGIPEEVMDRVADVDYLG
jgi:ketopantoate reductase